MVFLQCHSGQKTVDRFRSAGPHRKTIVFHQLFTWTMGYAMIGEGNVGVFLPDGTRGFHKKMSSTKRSQRSQRRGRLIKMRVSKRKKLLAGQLVSHGVTQMVMILLNETWPAPQWYEGRAIDGHVISTILIFQYILHLRNWGCCQGRSLAEAGGFGRENGFCVVWEWVSCDHVKLEIKMRFEAPFLFSETPFEVMNRIVQKRAMRVEDRAVKMVHEVFNTCAQLLPADSTNIF